MSKLHVHVGEGLEEAAARFVEGWKGLERGEIDESETHISFASWEAMVAVLTPKRIELLRHLHREPAANILTLSKALGRDYKRVYEDVQALQGAGLINQEDGRLTAEYDEIRTTLAL